MLLYLHGLHATPHPQKVDALARLGWAVHAPHIDYQTPGVWRRLLDGLDGAIIESGEPLQWVVGSSMGGYVGEAIARLRGVPMLSFNPALPYRTQIDPLLPPDLPPLAHPHHVVVGLQDEVIDPQATLAAIAERADWPYQVYQVEHMGHRNPPELFAGYAQQVIGVNAGA